MTTELTETSQNLPAFMQKYGKEGASDISADMIDKSFLIMCHESKKDGPDLGDWIDHASGQSLGPEIVATPVKIGRSWRKFDGDFKLVASSSDGIYWDNNDKLSDDEKWQCAFIDVFVLLNGKKLPVPYIISFKGMSFKTGKQFAKTVRLAIEENEEPIFARNYTFFTETGKKGTKEYSLAKFRMNDGFNTDEFAELCFKARTLVKDVEANMDSEVDAEPDDSEAGQKDFTQGDID
jgi:hypothetical protein